ncbi:MAG: hypothetical protein K2K74_20145 [Lachnospiraceae bacterium]|nr:hypothetical protein [Lachnospiraceae bacterium]
MPDDAKICPSYGTPVASGNELNIKDIANFAGNRPKDEYDAMK